MGDKYISRNSVQSDMVGIPEGPKSASTPRGTIGDSDNESSVTVRPATEGCPAPRLVRVLASCHRLERPSMSRTSSVRWSLERICNTRVPVRYGSMAEVITSRRSPLSKSGASKHSRMGDI